MCRSLSCNPMIDLGDLYRQVCLCDRVPILTMKIVVYSSSLVAPKDLSEEVALGSRLPLATVESTHQ